MLFIEEMAIRRGQGSQQFNVLLPKLELQDGEILAIQGASGCGKVPYWNDRVDFAARSFGSLSIGGCR